MRTRIVFALVAVLAGAGTSKAEAPKLPVVDAGIRWIQKCATDSVAFRNPSDGWLWSACGDIYRSDDQGHTWREMSIDGAPLSLFPKPKMGSHVGQVQFVAWLTEQIGLIGGLPSHIARTTDGGQTWNKLPIPTTEGIWQEEHVGSRVWLCDGRGSLIRSDDGGVNWRPLSTIGNSFGCFDLSFADRDHGWASVPMLAGTIFETDDGGATWKKVALPRADFQNPMVFRATKDVGWVYDTSVSPGERDLAAIRTTDGGKTWAKAEVPQSLAPKLFVSHVEGVAHDVMAAVPVRDVAQLVKSTPVPPRFPYARADAHLAIRIDDGLLRFYGDGKLIASTGVLGRGKGAKESLLGVIETKREGGMWGWSERHVFHSNDRGATWFVVSDAPNPPLETMVLVNDATALARTRSGKLFRSDGWFRQWYETDDPANEDDFARLAPKAARNSK